MLLVNDVIKNLTSPTHVPRLPTPQYTGQSISHARGVFLAVESMQRHTTDEGWQIAEGLQQGAWYKLVGRGLERNETNVRKIVEHLKPEIVVMQDKREWDVHPRDFRDQTARFINYEVLKERKDIFKLTILKDSHQRPEYHRQAADEIDCHAWIIYYHPKIVHHLAPWTRAEHLIRTYHTVNVNHFLPGDWNRKRSGCIISGAVSSVYPLRRRLIDSHYLLPQCFYLKHPGYHMRGTHTSDFVRRLHDFKVSICTASIYGYALRKIIESTAAGCIVVTDLPADEVLPEIDDNLVRIRPDTTPEELALMLPSIYDTWEEERQRDFANRAKKFYSHVEMGKRLANDIEQLRQSYPIQPPMQRIGS